MAELKARGIPDRTPAENLLPEYGTTASEYGTRRLPNDADLNAAAKRVGSAVGDAAASMRQVREKLQVVPRQMNKLKDRMAERSSQAAQQFSERAQEFWSQARQRMVHARRQIVASSQEKPFHAIAIAAGTAFALGVGLRIWRNRG